MALFPGWWVTLGGGLDQSYVWALNWLRGSPFRFGADLVFNYGPLGFLLFPAAMGSNRALGIAFSLTVHAALVGLLWHHLRRAPAAAALLSALCLALARATGSSMEYVPLAPMLLLVLAALEAASALPMLPAGLLAGAFLFIKASAGLGAAGALLLAGLLALEEERRGKKLAAGAAGFAIGLVGVGLLETGSPTALARFLRGSWEISRSYDASMSLVGPPRELWLALPPALAALALPLWLWRRDRPAARSAVVALPLLFVAFKHGFVRQDLHVLAFFSTALLAAGIVGATARERATVRAVAAWAAIAAAAAGAMLGGRGVLDLRQRGAVLTLEAGLDAIGSLVRDDLRRAAARETEARDLAAIALPPPFRAAIGDGTCDAIPHHLALLPASGLRWSPSPTLQAYDATTLWLDAWTAAHTRSDRAAAFVVVDLADVFDARHLLLQSPQAWAALREWYDPDLLDAAAQRLLLRRRPAPRPAPALRPLDWRTTGTSAWLDVPDGAALLALEARPSLRGRLTRALFRWPALWLDVRYRDGGEARFRVLPDLLPAGLPVASLPRSAEELRDLLAGAPVAQVAQVRLGGNALKYLAPTIQSRFLLEEQAPR